MNNRIKIIVFHMIFMSFTLKESFADLSSELSQMVGYTIVDSKTIEGWSEDGKSEDSFEGCSYDRKIVFTDGSYLKCREYGYMYAYRPTAVILAKEYTHNGKSFFDFKMVVEDEIYDMSRY